MAKFSVEYSDQFSADLKEIADDSQRWGSEATKRYIRKIVERCKTLDEMPNRFAKQNMTLTATRFIDHSTKAHTAFSMRL